MTVKSRVSAKSFIAARLYRSWTIQSYRSAGSLRFPFFHVRMASLFPLTTGQVNFCDATAAYCTDVHILATAQLTSSGTATYKFRPGIGSHIYEAVFARGRCDSAPH